MMLLVSGMLGSISCDALLATITMPAADEVDLAGGKLLGKPRVAWAPHGRFEIRKTLVVTLLGMVPTVAGAGCATARSTRRQNA
jgi:hypothetical protein